MPTIDVWLTVVHGVNDTTAKDFHRSERVFVHVPSMRREMTPSCPGVSKSGT
jgi:hypothetical protein